MTGWNTFVQVSEVFYLNLSVLEPESHSTFRSLEVSAEHLKSQFNVLVIKSKTELSKLNIPAAAAAVRSGLVFIIYH